MNPPNVVRGDPVKFNFILNWGRSESQNDAELKFSTDNICILKVRLVIGGQALSSKQSAGDACWGDGRGAWIVGVIALAPAKLICIYWGGWGNPLVSHCIVCCIHCIAGVSIGEVGRGAILLTTYTLSLYSALQ